MPIPQKSGYEDHRYYTQALTFAILEKGLVCLSSFVARQKHSRLELTSVRLLVTCSLARNGEGGRSQMPMWATSGDKTIEVMLNLFRSAGC